MFVRSADENYITARWAAMHHFHSDFAWLSVHALEKYLKATLLSNGCSTIGNGSKNHKWGHCIVDLGREVVKIAADLVPLQLNSPERLPEGLIYRSVSTDEALQNLYDIGSPDNRYKIFGTSVSMDSLAKVDQLVFIFRRLIVPLDKFAPDEFLTFREILKNEPHHIGSRNMPLGKEIFDIDSRARNIALNCNLSFSPSQ
jgi:hypothetical protein